MTKPLTLGGPCRALPKFNLGGPKGPDLAILSTCVDIIILFYFLICLFVFICFP
jgi:hypothetical protein